MGRDFPSSGRFAATFSREREKGFCPLSRLRERVGVRASLRDYSRASPRAIAA